MMIEFDNRQEKIDFSESIKGLIFEAVEASLKYEGFREEYELSVVITDNVGIREINREFRDIDRETDVLSFPMLEFEEGYSEEGEFEIDFEDKNPETGAVVLGDIVLSLEKAATQSREYGHSIEREVGFLIVHSCLHLLGYDHENGEDRNIMREKEEKILIEMGLTRQ